MERCWKGNDRIRLRLSEGTGPSATVSIERPKWSSLRPNPVLLVSEVRNTKVWPLSRRGSSPGNSLHFVTIV
jgi:hypothetical protein